MNRNKETQSTKKLLNGTSTKENTFHAVLGFITNNSLIHWTSFGCQGQTFDVCRHHLAPIQRQIGNHVVKKPKWLEKHLVALQNYLLFFSSADSNDEQIIKSLQVCHCICVVVLPGDNCLCRSKYGFSKWETSFAGCSLVCRFVDLYIYICIEKKI